MSYIFSKCSSLLTLPDLSKWNTNNVIDMSYMFLECSSLSSLPDISKWNSKINDIFTQSENLILSKQILKSISFQAEDYNEIENEDNSIKFIF